MEPDFSGYATKAGLECSDGRTITPEAFKHQDKMRVPLLWQHGHNNIENILGHAILEARDDGMYCQGFFNSSGPGQLAKEAVAHGDVDKMSIFARQLRQNKKLVVHGSIKEVSLCIAGANPGAEIDFVAIRHSDGEVEDLDDEAVITTGLAFEVKHSENDDEDEDKDELEHDDNSSVQDVYDGMSEEQKNVVHYLLGEAIQSALDNDSVAHSDITGTGANGAITHKDQYDALSDEQRKAVDALISTAVEDANLAHADKEGNEMGNHNVFESQNGGKASKTLSHSEFETVVTEAQKSGSFKEALEGFLEHATDYGIEDIDVLFPDAKMDGNGVTYLSRRMEWVQNVLTNTKHSPFSRVKSLSADITADEARAKGYVKGNLKKDEIIKMLKRVTTPTTIYKKQKLDRDDIVDITDLDVVAWLKGEMRIMLDEEVARAILIGDGREGDDEDKINEDCIRPIAFDVDMYNTTVILPTDTDGNTVSGDDLVDAVVNAMNKYKGTGTPTLYTELSTLTNLMLSKDKMGRRLYPTKAELAAAMMVSDIIAVEVLESEADVVGIIVNLVDYTVGADAGGNVNMFDDFDIDYNQQKYLIEVRMSGALTRPKSAITLTQATGRIVTPTAPTMNNATFVVTIPSQTGTVYSNSNTGQQLASGPQAPLTAGQSFEVVADPAQGYGFVHDSDRNFVFTRPAS